jgi:hypothetical protein
MRKTKGKSDYQQMLHTISFQRESNLWDSSTGPHIYQTVTLGHTKSIGRYNRIS